VASYRIAALAVGYVAAIVGAGFVSGREIQVFFIDPGPSLWGIVVTAVLFALLGIVITDLSARWEVTNYRDLLVKVAGPAAPAADIVLGAFVFVTFCAVEAGGGELLRSLTGMPRIPASALWGLSAVLALLLTGRRLRVIQGVLMVILVSALLLAYATVPAGAALWTGAGAHAYGSHLLYVGYNVMLAVAALPALAAKTPRHIERRTGAVAGAMAIAIAIYAIADVVQRAGPGAQSHPLPAWFAAARGPHWLVPAMAIAIAAATAGALISYLIALTTRYPVLTRPWPLMALWAASLVVSSSGLVAIVDTAYPIMGLVSCTLLAAFVVRWISGG